MEKAPTEKREDLFLKSILKKYRVQASFTAREGEMGGTRGDGQPKTPTGSEEDGS